MTSLPSQALMYKKLIAYTFYPWPVLSPPVFFPPVFSTPVSSTPLFPKFRKLKPTAFEDIYLPLLASEASGACILNTKRLVNSNQLLDSNSYY